MDELEQPETAKRTALQSPAQPLETDAAQKHRWLWLSMAAVLLLGLVLIFMLPRLVSPPGETSLPIEPPATTGSAAALRESANQTLQTYLQLHARLELDNAGTWGEPNWSEAAALATAGDRHFAQLRFSQAAAEYQSAIDHLRQLDSGRAVILDTALREAANALAANDPATAIEQFKIALAIAPGDPAATRGLVQAHSRSEVIEQMNRGRTAEANNDLETALAAYRQAAQLDADYEPATASLQRVTEQINSQDFNTAMTQALAALDSGRPDAAEEALAEAERLRPGDGAVLNARQRLQGMQVQAALNDLRRKAAIRAGGEQWQAAVELYRKALSIDPMAGFASEGERRASERIKLHAQFDHYLDAPARVYSAAPLANARQLLAAAPMAPANEPRLAAKISALRALVARAGTPLTLTLNSDGMTSVVVYRVARLGQFETRQLQLLPGDYTIVGRRPGYRDIRKVITVRPEFHLQPLTIRCEEPI